MAGKGSRVNFDTSGLRRIAARIENLSAQNLEKVRARAVSSMVRSVKAETARQVSEVQLNLSVRAISPHILVRTGKAGDTDYVSVFASTARLPLSAFKPSISKSRGVTVKTWRDSPPLRLPHGFARGKEVWQRAPYRGQKGQSAAPSGLVQRLPIVMRKGPSLKRALQPTGPSQESHGRERVVEHLMRFGQAKLAAEIQRLLRYT